MISYAQNFEDVILHRALMDVEEGFYVDVGANDPDIDSVTRFFYESGWTGINIEPVEYWQRKLRVRRPRDINLALAAGAQTGTLTFCEVIGTGLSTMDFALAESYQREGGHDVIVREVEVTPLDVILQQYRDEPIHFLKIDVEGFEGEVLKGLNLQGVRPWIILIEAVNPITREVEFPWEEPLLKAGYVAVYFDGLNRFYLAAEQIQRKQYFYAPPNVFDRFSLSGESTSTFSAFLNERITELNAQIAESNAQIAESNAQIAESNAQIAESKDRITELNAQITESKDRIYDLEQRLRCRTNELNVRECELALLREELKALSDQLNLILESKSWALTRPVRWSGLQVRLLKQYGLWSRVGALCRKLLYRGPQQEIDHAIPYTDPVLTKRAQGLLVALNAMDLPGKVED